MHHETHRVTAYATGLRTQTTEELRANRLFLWNHTHRCIITISGMYYADCRVSDGLLVPRSAERTAELTTRIPDATHAGPVEEIGEYDLGVYVPDDDTDRLYLATADPAGSDWRGVIAHVPSEHVYELANVPPTGDEPLFDEPFPAVEPAETTSIYRNVETGVRGGLSQRRFERLRTEETLVDVIPAKPGPDRPTDTASRADF